MFGLALQLESYKFIDMTVIKYC